MLKDAWPPAYQIRKSKRAKRLQISVCRIKGVRVVIPYRASYREAEEFLHAQRPWIEQRLAEIAMQNHLDHPHQLPDTVLFHSVDQLWHIHYQPDDNRPRLTETAPFQLVMRGQVTFETGQRLLKNWLKKQAKLILLPWLHELCVETGLQYNNVKIRSQSTRWGSCSHNRDINLNSKLLFLPEALVENILLHELCHIKHLDHSEKFWGLMQQHQPNALEFAKQARAAQRYVPAWVES